jgi:hypothetical protein
MAAKMAAKIAMSAKTGASFFLPVEGRFCATHEIAKKITNETQGGATT